VVLVFVGFVYVFRIFVDIAENRRIYIFQIVGLMFLLVFRIGRVLVNKYPESKEMHPRKKKRILFSVPRRNHSILVPQVIFAPNDVFCQFILYE